MQKNLPEKSGPKRPSGETRALVKTHHDNGLTPRQIARLLEISTQAVYQHLQAIRDAEAVAS